MGQQAHTMNIYTDRPCTHCGAKGATDSGLCLKCITKNVRIGKIDPAVTQIRAAVLDTLVGAAHRNQSNERRETKMSEREPVAGSFMRQLPVVLSRTELIDRSKTLGTKMDERDQIEVEFTGVKQNFKGRIEGITTEISHLQRVVVDGKEKRDVECVIQKDWDQYRIVTVRIDTGEEIEGRPMTPQERQQILSGMEKDLEG